MNFTDEQYMREAVEQAKLAKASGTLPFGAVVVCNGKVVGKGKCEDQITGDVTAHAELLSLREACKTLGRKNLADCIIYCTNEPCPMCAAGIFQAKIPRVVIGLSREDLTKFLRPRKINIDMLAQDSGYPIVIERGLLRVEMQELFKDIVKGN